MRAAGRRSDRPGRRPAPAKYRRFGTQGRGKAGTRADSRGVVSANAVQRGHSMVRLQKRIEKAHGQKTVAAHRRPRAPRRRRGARNTGPRVRVCPPVTRRRVSRQMSKAMGSGATQTRRTRSGKTNLDARYLPRPSHSVNSAQQRKGGQAGHSQNFKRLSTKIARINAHQATTGAGC